MTDLFIRIDKFMAFKGLNDNKISLETGISNGLIGKGRKRGSISLDNISKILSTYSELSSEWLLRGIGEMIKKEIPQTNKKLVPVYTSKAQAGIGAMFQEFTHCNPIDYIQVPHIHNADAAIFSFGDSMLPLISSGDLLVYKQFNNINSIIPGKIYIISFELEDDIATVVKYVKNGSTEETITLVSENSFYQPMEIQKKAIKSFARVLCTVKYNN